MRVSSLIAAVAAAGVATAQTLPTTYTITKTVERVVQTTWATSTEPAATWAAPVPSTYASAASTIAYGNGTASGTGASPYGSSTSVPTVQPATGAASRLGLDAIGMLAVLGFVGMVAF